MIDCRTYTHARRHPLVIGKIGGWTIPSPLTPSQLVTGLGSFYLLLKARVVWAHLPGMGNLVVLLGVPIVLMWAVRHLRVEGRSPLRALLGLGVLLSTPRSGVMRGRPHRAPRKRRLRRLKIHTAASGASDILPEA